MLTSFVLSMALAAPIPPEATTPPAANAGPVPRLMEVKAADGKVTITVNRASKEQIQVGIGAVAPGGNVAPAVITREIAVAKPTTVELRDVKDLTITTASGKKVDVADAMKQLKNGGVVVVSADGKPVSASHLKLFKDDVLVLASPELVGEQPTSTAPGRPGKPLPGKVRPLPAPVPGVVVPANPGIQIQILPAQPVPLPAPVPAPEK